MLEASNQFYPTPKNVAEIMKSKVTIRIDHSTEILDPEAGTGSLLDLFRKTKDYFEEKYGDELKSKFGYERYLNSREKCKLYAIEIDLDLRYTLRGKDIKVIGSDFLEWTEAKTFNLVIMNPPFNQGVSHVLKAWELVKSGGQLIALLNSETFNNLCSEKRKLLYSLIEQFGSVESLGSCFSEADRPTDIDVSLIVLNKPKRTQQDLFLGFANDTNSNFTVDKSRDSLDFEASPLASIDKIDCIVDHYNASERALVGKCKYESELKYWMKGINVADLEKEDTRDFDEQLHDIKSNFWDEVIDRSKLRSKMTSDFRVKFDDFVKSQKYMSFNKSNILEMFTIFFGNKEQIMQDSITEVFDIACRFDEKNKVHTEGWKTNDAWKVNKKVIIPYGVKIQTWGSVNFDHWGKAEKFLGDLDNVLAYITGINIETLENPSVVALRRFLDKYNDPKTPYPFPLSQEIDSSFITLRIYKKGTIHIKFKDLDLLDEFNYRAGLGKLWIPDESSNVRNSKKKNTKLTVK